MSKRAILTAVRDQLRTVLNYTPSQCDRTFDGHPPPNCGKLFVAVHRAPRQSDTGQDAALEEFYGALITITMRISVPYDRLSQDVLDNAEDGIEDLADLIKGPIHMNTDVMNAANAIIGSNENGFVEPLRFAGDDPPRIVGSDWFFAKPDDSRVGIAMTLNFSRARRIQLLENIVYDDI